MPGLLSALDFDNLRQFLTATQTPKFKCTEHYDIVEIASNASGENIRCISTPGSKGKEICQKKIRQHKKPITIPSIGVRITQSTEQSEDKPKIWKPHLRRRRQRYSFSSNDKNAKYSYISNKFVIDLTIVQEDFLSWDSTAGGAETVTKSTVKYEVEIEVKKACTTREFASTVLFVYRGSVANLAPIEQSISSDDMFMTLGEREFVVN